jgi:hypothetical protein
VSAPVPGDWIAPPTCRQRITIPDGVMRGERVFCMRKPAAGQDLCGQHLARQPWMRRYKETSR